MLHLTVVITPNFLKYTVGVTVPEISSSNLPCVPLRPQRSNLNKYLTAEDAGYAGKVLFPVRRNLSEMKPMFHSPLLWTVWK